MSATDETRPILHRSSSFKTSVGVEVDAEGNACGQHEPIPCVVSSVVDDEGEDVNYDGGMSSTLDRALELQFKVAKEQGEVRGTGECNSSRHEDGEGVEVSAPRETVEKQCEFDEKSHSYRTGEQSEESSGSADNYSDHGVVEESSSDDDEDFLKSCLLPHRTASTLSYEEHENAMRLLHSKWEGALETSMKQSEELLLEQSKIMDEERQIQELRSQEEVDRAMEIALQTEERSAEFEAAHAQEVSELKEEIEKVKNEMLIQSQTIIDEMAAEAEESKKIAVIEAMEAVCEEMDAVRVEGLAELQAQLDKIKAAGMAEGNSEERFESIRKQAQKERDDAINEIKENTKVDMDVAIAETEVRVRFKVEEQCAAEREEAVRDCKRKCDEERVRAVEEAVAAARKENEANLQSMVNQQVEVTTEVLKLKHEEEMTQLKIDMETMLREARDECGKTFRRLKETHEREKESIQKELEMARDSQEDEKGQQMEAIVEDVVREAVSEVRENLGKEHLAELEKVQEEKRREVSEAKKMATSQINQLTSRHETKLRELAEKAAKEWAETNVLRAELDQARRERDDAKQKTESMSARAEVNARSTKESVQKTCDAGTKGKDEAIASAVAAALSEQESKMKKARDEAVARATAEKEKELTRALGMSVAARVEEALRSVEEEHKAKVAEAIKVTGEKTRVQLEAELKERLDSARHETEKKAENDRSRMLEETRKMIAEMTAEKDKSLKAAVQFAVQKEREIHDRDLQAQKDHREEVYALAMEEMKLKIVEDQRALAQSEIRLLLASDGSTGSDVSDRIASLAADLTSARAEAKMVRCDLTIARQALADRDDMIKSLRKELSLNAPLPPAVEATRERQLTVDTSHPTDESSKSISDGIRPADNAAGGTNLGALARANACLNAKYASQGIATQIAIPRTHSEDTSSAERAAGSQSDIIVPDASQLSTPATSQPDTPESISTVERQFQALSPLTMGTFWGERETNKRQSYGSEGRNRKSTGMSTRQRGATPAVGITTSPSACDGSRRRVARKAPLPTFSKSSKNRSSQSSKSEERSGKTGSQGTAGSSGNKENTGGFRAFRSPSGHNSSPLLNEIKTPGEKSANTARTGASGRSSQQLNRSSKKKLRPTSSIDPKDVRIIVINTPLTSKIRSMVRALGATLVETVEDAASATHVIAGDSGHSLRRTPKMMICLSVTSNILHLDWLKKSHEAHSFLACHRYLLVHDEIAEKNYSFSMKQTLHEGNERRKEGGLLAGWRILFCDGVAGNKAPKEHELDLIVTSAGGSVLTISDLPLRETEDNAHVIVVTSDPASPEQKSDGRVIMAAKRGAGLFTTAWLFECIMHQKLTGIKRGLGRSNLGVRPPTIAEEIAGED